MLLRLSANSGQDPLTLNPGASNTLQALKTTLPGTDCRLHRPSCTIRQHRSCPGHACPSMQASLVAAPSCAKQCDKAGNRRCDRAQGFSNTSASLQLRLAPPSSALIRTARQFANPSDMIASYRFLVPLPLMAATVIDAAAGKNTSRTTNDALVLEYSLQPFDTLYSRPTLRRRSNSKGCLSGSIPKQDSFAS